MLKGVKENSNENTKSSSKIAFFVFVIAIIHFMEGRFISFRPLLFRTCFKKTSKNAAYVVRRYKKNEQSLHKRAIQKKRAIWHANR